MAQHPEDEIINDWIEAVVDGTAGIDVRRCRADTLNKTKVNSVIPG
jgi:hypothetical protein